jgi:tRNA-specific 2-thiouridylase
MGRVRELGCDHLVTGHYARIRQDREGRYRLQQARGRGKDQSYVLYMLSQEQLSKTWFPLGEIEDKSKTRAMAAEMGLHLADKPDSQEICFVSEAGGYTEFLKKQRPEVFREGQILDSSGKRLGTHGGVAAFTVGQRRGLRLPGGDPSPLYVLRVVPSSNAVIVGGAEELLRREVSLDQPHWATAVSERCRVRAKIRYNMDPQPATLFPGEQPKLVFDDPVRAVTPGQIAVAYRGKTVLAGGVIAA